MVKVIVVLVIVVKRVFSLAKTIVVDVIVIYIPRIPVVFFVMGIWNPSPNVWKLQWIELGFLYTVDYNCHIRQCS